jgi:hypothetical protein
MKKLLFLVIVSSILLIACSAPFFALGTSEEMFLKKSPGSKLIEKNSERTVYLRGWSLGYYYFNSQGALFQIDMGKRQADITIEQTIRKK